MIICHFATQIKRVCHGNIKLSHLLSVRRTTHQSSAIMHRNKTIKYLTQDEAIRLDQELFDEFGFTVHQLMELAGLGVASAVAKTYPTTLHKNVLICCGPGNNGGDGLVAARHLKLFGFEPFVVCPKVGKGELFERLILQCKKFDIQVSEQVPDLEDLESKDIRLFIDAIFGFSYKPPNRSRDYAKLINLMHNSPWPVVSVDIPSGWVVDTTCSAITSPLIDDQVFELAFPILKPDCLVSLTAPKICSKNFQGRFHYLAGRFCPPAIQTRYQLNLPEYLSHDQIVLLNQS